MTGLVLAALLAFAPPQSLSGSSNAGTESDFRCYAAAVVMAGMTEGSDTAAFQSAAMIAFYYLGRLEGREPATDWITKGIQIGNTEEERLMAELPRCGAEFQRKGQEMVDKSEAAA